MPPTEFKLSRRNGVTRRTAFPERPTWKVLSARASELFNIPIGQIAVSYIDSDGDEVTLNTEEELAHFYQTSNLNGTIKFFVQDLDSLRSLPTSTPPSFLAPSFGPDPPIEEEWHNFDNVFVAAPSMQSHRVFVDDADSDTDSIYKPLSEPRTNLDHPPAAADKGKAKAVKLEDLIQSLAASVISGDAPAKPPIHVYDYSTTLEESPNAPTAALAESTPRAPLSEAGNEGENDQKMDLDASADDPPLPLIEPHTPPSLSNDIASLISALGNVVFSHPELSESIHSIFRNTSDGTYWKAHRDAISKAAEEITQASGTMMQDVLHEPEAEAGQRVWQALNAFFRSLSQVAGAPPSDQKPSSPPAQRPAENNTTSQNQASSSAAADSEPQPVHGKEEQPSQPEPPKEEEQLPFVNRSSEWQSYLRPPAPPSPFAPQSYYSQPPLAPPFPPNPFGYFHPPPRHSFMPLPFPPPPHVTASLPPPPPPPLPPVELSTPYVRGQGNLDRSFSVSSHFNSRAPEVVEMKAKVHAAKSTYRAEKARYEQARQRQRGRSWFGPEHKIGEIQPPEGFQPFTVTEGPITQGITNTPGSQSPFEMSIPGSFPPQHRPRSFHDNVIEDFRSRAVKRICRQLSDMGFTEGLYPGLAEKVAARLPARGSITKDIEDGIVTNLLEELLTASLTATGPIASGSKPTSPH